MEVEVSTKTLQLSADSPTVPSHYRREIFVQLITPMKFQSDIAVGRKTAVESTERGGADLRGGRRARRRWALLRRRGGALSPRSERTTAGPRLSKPMVCSHNSVVQRCGRYTALCRV